MVGTRIENPRRRRLVHGANVLVQIVLALWFVVMLNGWVFEYIWRMDFTADSRLTLPDETVRLLQQLPNEVVVVVAHSRVAGLEGILRQRVLDRATSVLREMEQITPRFRIAEVLDPPRQREAWEVAKAKYGLHDTNRIYFVVDNDAERHTEAVALDDLVVFRPYDPKVPGSKPGIQSEHVVEGITATIRRALSLERPKVRFAQGHGEISPQSDELMPMWTALSDRGYDLGTIDLGRESKISSDVEIVVVVAATSPGLEYTPYEAATRDAIDRYLQSGGNLLLFAPFVGECGLEPLLERYGIGLKAGLVSVVGPDPGRARGPTRHLFLNRVSGRHPITKAFESTFVAQVRNTRALDVEPPARSIVQTSPECWLDADIGRIGVIRRDASDPAGPFTVVAAAERSDRAEQRSRVLTFGCAQFGARDYFHVGTRQLVLNGFYWLSDQQMFAAGTGRVDRRDVIVQDSSTLSQFLWTGLLLPVVAAACGLIITLWRRRSA